MTGNRVQFNQYLENTLRIQDLQVRNAINAQGLESFDDLESLTDQDIKDICDNLKSPGGTIPNPDAGVPGQPATIPNRGVAFGFIFVKRLRQIRYFYYHLNRIQRAFAPNLATLNALGTYWRRHEEEEKDQDDIDEPAPLRKLEDVRQTLENIDEYLITKRGACGAPLAYIVRDQVDLPEDVAGEQDPGIRQPNMVTELIRRTRHDGEYYAQDNKAVWSLIRTVMHPGPGWSWVQPYAKTQNGRMAYLAIKKHYLGESFQARIKATADKIVDTAYYDGKEQHTFEEYCELLQGAFTDLEENGEKMPESRKVRKLLTGIIDPDLETAKNTVLATANLKADFNAAMNFIAEFADTKESMRQKTTKKEKVPREVSALKSKNEHTHFTGHYTYEEWQALPDKEKYAIYEARAMKRKNDHDDNVDGTGTAGADVPKEDSEQDSNRGAHKKAKKANTTADAQE